MVEAETRLASNEKIAGATPVTRSIQGAVQRPERSPKPFSASATLRPPANTAEAKVVEAPVCHAGLNGCDSRRRCHFDSSPSLASLGKDSSLVSKRCQALYVGMEPCL